MSISRGQPQDDSAEGCNPQTRKKQLVTSLLAEYRDVFAWSLMLPVPTSGLGGVAPLGCTV